MTAKTKFPGWRTMTSAQRYNAKADAIFEQAKAFDRQAIAAAKAAGWTLNPAINKWQHPKSSAAYCDTPRWGRYACEDHGISFH